MAKHTNDEGAAEVVEAPGFMVRDPQGRTRVFIGDLSGTDGYWLPGEAIYDERGSERVSLLLTARSKPHVRPTWASADEDSPFRGWARQSIRVATRPLMSNLVR